MPMPSLAPITDDELEEFCKFLHDNLNQRLRTEDWAAAFRVNWVDDKPNYGYLLRNDAGQIVGGIGAIYSQQIIHGKPERFCNITSWCVLDEHRSQSMRLAMAVISQAGYHFTDLTPTSVVAESLRFLKFSPLNSDRTVIFNLPWPVAGFNGIHVITDEKKIEQVLPDDAARQYCDNRGFPWIRYAAVGKPGAFCLVIFRQGTLRNLPCADILEISDSHLYQRYYRTLGNYLLIRLGMVTTFVETRLLHQKPLISTQLSGYRTKMYRSNTLADTDISNLYSELICMQL